jgi:hypothetical protein
MARLKDPYLISTLCLAGFVIDSSAFAGRGKKTRRPLFAAPGTT